MVVCRLFLPISITTDCSNKYNRPDYVYGRCIGTALPLTLHSLHRFIERFFKRDYSEALPTQHWAFAPFAECPEVVVCRQRPGLAGSIKLKRPPCTQFINLWKPVEWAYVTTKVSSWSEVTLWSQSTEDRVRWGKVETRAAEYSLASNWRVQSQMNWISLLNRFT